MGNADGNGSQLDIFEKAALADLIDGSSIAVFPA